ncbi:MAG: YfcC family protein, partial [Alphaproteobacteria bacterium]
MLGRVPLAVALGYDVITGIAIPFVGTQLGFAAAFVNPFTLGIAKGIAEEPLDAGRGYRILCWALLTTFGIGLVMWHAWRVRRDPTRSPSP